MMTAIMDCIHNVILLFTFQRQDTERGRKRNHREIGS